MLFYYTYTRSLHTLGYFYYPEPNFTHLVIRWIPYELFPTLIPVVVSLHLLFSLILGIYPWISAVRIVHFFLHIIYFAYISSFGHDANDHYVITFILPLLLFLKKPFSTKEDRVFNSHLLTLTQVGVVMSYAMAGIYKIRAIPNHNIDSLMGNLGNVIAFEHFQRGHTLLPISEFFIENDWVTGPMFIVTILIQALSPLGAYFKKTQLVTGLLLCLFHYLSEVIVHISFRPQMAAVIILLIFLPLFRKYEERHSGP